MPSNLPSSFASAAAGQNRDPSARGARGADGRGTASGEWSRQGRSTNGTLTFRRTSTTPSSQTSSQMLPDSAAPSSSVMDSDPAVISMGMGAMNQDDDLRYSRDNLLALSTNSSEEVSSLLDASWNPGQVNGGALPSSRAWGKPDHSHPHPAPQEPDLCWDATGSTKPIGMLGYSPEERDLFSADINSTLKPPAQVNKEGTQTSGLNGRKASLSHGSSTHFSVNSPSASRPGTRRRETTDTNPFSPGGGASLASPARSTRDDPPVWGFGRRANTDLKDTSTYEEPEEDTDIRAGGAIGRNLPFGGLQRNNTLSAITSGLGPSSPWGSNPSSATAAPGAGMGSFGNFAMPGSSAAVGERRPPNPRGESRLTHLMPNKDSSDNLAGKSTDTSAADASSNWRTRPRTDTDPFGEDNLSGSAVLGGAQDTSPPPLSHPPLRSQTFDTPVKGSAADLGMSGLNLGSHPDDGASLSPSETNPYRSPPGERGGGVGVGGGEHDEGPDKPHGFGSVDPMAGFSGLPRPFGHAGFDGSDRSQTSSVGAKALPSLSNLTAWPSSATPDRERAGAYPGFGNSLFGHVGDLQSPSINNLSNIFGAPAGGLSGSGSISRGSKLGSLFPPAMQAQMQSQDNDESLPDLRQGNPLGAIGRNPLGEPSRDSESPMRHGRGPFGDLFAPPEANRTPGAPGDMGGVGLGQAPGFTPPNNPPAFAQSAEAPSAQSRTMVMPDRMRWVYLDPQGNQQGPFTGLEMNDWYKAQFFTPNLRVKKLEDPDFEPLGQLIRRIGNSREPFLVPQIGIPHGPPTQAGPFSPTAGGVIQPPLVGAFPSFGRTLTAEEQNNLERRKQEEQYLMARQREYLTNQQGMPRAPMHPGIPGLNHHSSAHSLQSQPSFGSMTSPMNMPPQASVGPIGSGASMIDSQAPSQQLGATTAHGAGMDMLRDEDFSRLTEQERQVLAGIHGSSAQQPIGGPAAGETSMRAHLPGTEELLEDSEGFRGRLQQFEHLRAEHDAETAEGMSGSQDFPDEQSPAPASPPVHEDQSSYKPTADENSGLAQYQQAQAAVAAAKISSGLPMPFPPPQSSTPLAAPAPQRVKSNLPDQYNQASRSGTPDVAPASAASQPPPLAPWAKPNEAESHKGPSLKEIQAAEAAKAAKAEEAQAMARRIMVEQEAARERERSAAAASGLPTTSTWGTASPSNAGAGSPWAKPAATKAPATGNTAAVTQSSDKKKTLADIQREEEARKQKAKDLATAQTGTTPTGANNPGKRYADLASKPNAMVSPGQAANASLAAAPPAAGWATVGAGGKVKAPSGPAAQSRSTSTSSMKPAVVAAPSPKPVVKAANPSTTTGGNGNLAMDEFNKWLTNQLQRGLTSGTDVDVFAQTLLVLPPMPDVISDAVYANSKTMDGRHFAQEFVRRKKQAEKGVVEKQPIPSPSADTQASTAGGWNEVAKKSNHKETPTESSSIQAAGFKVVPSRKKGKK